MSGQFEELDEAGERILRDDEDSPTARPPHAAK
jgi:nitrogen fixation-related uncharacterized protein